MCDISHSLNRHEVVDFSDYLYSDDHTFIAQHPSDLQDITWSYLLLPFDLLTWMLIAITMLALFCALILKDRIRGRVNVGNNFLKAVSVFLMQCMIVTF